MDWEWVKYIEIPIIGALTAAIAKSYFFSRDLANKLWDALNAHKEKTNEMYLEIIQIAIPNALKDVKDDIKEIKLLLLKLIENRKK